MLKNKSLEEFGYNFLGPILASYVIEINRKVKLFSKGKGVKVFHLAREGYAFEKAFNIVNGDNLPSSYLNVSRTFLFRITSDMELSWQFSVKHNFEGTLEEFFHARFAFSKEQISLFLTSQQAKASIKLPDDYDSVCEVLKTNQPKISEIVGPTRQTYLEYLESLGFTEPESTPLVLDVGYSGTIQKLLTLLVEKDTRGIYMITTASDDMAVGSSVAYIDHVFKTGVRMGNGYTMLDRSMFLESLLTAPNGQFVDILKDVNSESFHFCYGKRTYTQEHFSDLEIVLQGALSCVEHCLESDITYSVEELEQVFTAYVTQRNLLPKASWPLFVLDDAISGQGNLNPLTFFGL
jgi:hypothetical protein